METRSAMRVSGGARAFVVAVAMAWTSPAAAQETEHVLDLLRASEYAGDIDSVPAEERVTVPIGVSSHDTEVAPPVRVRLLSIDAPAYLVGEELIYEMSVENVGTAPLIVPTSIDEAQFRRTMSRARSAEFSLSFDDAVMGHHSVGYVAVFGADDVPGSLITLRPGDRIRVRAMGRWWGGGAILPGSDNWTSSNLQLYATVKLHHYGMPYKPAVSENRLPVEIRRR
jgi:hypothetical protein